MICLTFFIRFSTEPSTADIDTAIVFNFFQQRAWETVAD
jgi:hypothetical protein